MCPMANVLDSFAVYLSAANLEGVDRRVTVKDVTEEVQPSRNDDEEDVKAPILYIEEHPKGIRLNKTMATQLVDMFGTPDTNYWIGKQITLYPTKERAFGQTWDVIRIRDESPAQPAGSGFAGQPAGAPAQPAQAPQDAAQPAQAAPAAQPNPAAPAAAPNAAAPAEGGFTPPPDSVAQTREMAAANPQPAQQAPPQDQPQEGSEWFS